MADTWSDDDAGVLRLPSGRLVRGRGLRRPAPPGPAPTFGVYLLGAEPPATAWPRRWVRCPDFWVPRDSLDAADAFREAWQRAASEPKTVKWYDAGHRLGDDAWADQRAWLATQIGIDK